MKKIASISIICGLAVALPVHAVGSGGASKSGVSSAQAGEEFEQFNALTSALDEQDSKQLQSLVRQANACTSKRDYACTERLLEKARKLAHSGQDKKALVASAQTLSDERAAEERETAIRMAEEQRRIKEDEDRLAQEAERERIRNQRLMEEQEASNSRASEQAFGLQLLEMISKVGTVARQNNNELNAAQQQAQQIVQQRQQEADRKNRQAQELQRQARLEQQARLERLRPSEDDRRQRSGEQLGASVLKDRSTANGAMLASAELERKKQLREEEVKRQEQRDRELADIARKQEQEQEQARRERERSRREEEEAERLAALPRVGGPPNKDGCWIPMRKTPWCVVVTKAIMTKSGEVRVTYRNDCAWGVRIAFGNQRKDGSWDSGADHLASGASMTWWTSGGSGDFRYNFTGSAQSSNDWVCSGQNVDPGFETKSSGVVSSGG